MSVVISNTTKAAGWFAWAFHQTAMCGAALIQPNSDFRPSSSALFVPPICENTKLGAPQDADFFCAPSIFDNTKLGAIFDNTKAARRFDHELN